MTVAILQNIYTSVNMYVQYIYIYIYTVAILQLSLKLDHESVKRGYGVQT